MSQLTCKPFEDEEELKKPFAPFKSLVSSVIGQQVSWLAARSIQNKASFSLSFLPSVSFFSPSLFLFERAST
jgi:3-methyladenine DNA glycosylase/8-oxoguanine DNA glycosylase